MSMFAICAQRCPMCPSFKPNSNVVDIGSSPPTLIPYKKNEATLVYFVSYPVEVDTLRGVFRGVVQVFLQALVLVQASVETLSVDTSGTASPPSAAPVGPPRVAARGRARVSPVNCTARGRWGAFIKKKEKSMKFFCIMIISNAQ